MTFRTVAIGIVVGLATTEVAVVATTVYLHRTLAHRAVDVRPGIGLFFRVVLWVTTGMRRREWVAVHRRHHAAPDTADDPHSPLVLGFWRVQLGLIPLYRETARDGKTIQHFARDLKPDRLDRWLFDRRLLGMGLGFLGLTALFGLPVAVIAAPVQIVGYFALAGSMAALGHHSGARPFDNPGGNLQVLAALTFGEGLHNNHHAAPNAARFACARSDIDPGWWVVRGLSACRVATVRRRDVVRVPLSTARV
jgi:stearoyl-CoA desaturase (delta-9 desaturase)